MVNPKAANGRTEAIWSRLIKRSQSNTQYMLTKDGNHASEITAEALTAGYDTIVAVGGDGTVNSVLNGFYRDGVQINPDARLSYLPSGTGKDLARTLNLPHLTSAEVLQSLPAFRVSVLDHGVARFTGYDEQHKVRYFMNEASVGFSADTVAVVNRCSKVLGGKISFFLGVFRCLAGLKNHAIRIEVDGDHWYSGNAFLVTVANGRFFGGSMQIAPLAQINDNLFDIVLITALSRLEVVKYIGRIYSGAHLSLPQVKTTRGQSVRITSEEQVPLELDGEQPGTLDAEFTIIENGINFLMP